MSYHAMQCILYKIYFWKVFHIYCKLICILYALLCWQDFIFVKSGCCRSWIWASSHGQTQLGWGLVGCKIWFYPISKKSTSISVRMQKLWPFYRSTSGLRFWKAEYDSKLKSGKVKTCYLWRQRLIQWMERLKHGFTMNLGLAKREFTQGS